MPCGQAVIVRHGTPLSHSAAFVSTAKLLLNYDDFTEDVSLRLDVADKIAGGFGDPDSSQLAIRRIVPGSVELSWTNSSIPGHHTGCPVSTLMDIRSRMLLSDGSVNPR